jgi:hypothetical protein
MNKGSFISTAFSCEFPENFKLKLRNNFAAAILELGFVPKHEMMSVFLRIYLDHCDIRAFSLPVYNLNVTLVLLFIYLSISRPSCGSLPSLWTFLR